MGRIPAWQAVQLLSLSVSRTAQDADPIHDVACSSEVAARVPNHNVFCDFLVRLGVVEVSGIENGRLLNDFGGLPCGGHGALADDFPAQLPHLRPQLVQSFEFCDDLHGSLPRLLMVCWRPRM